MKTSFLQVLRYSRAILVALTRSSGWSPLTWMTGAEICLAMSVQWREERPLSPGVVKPTWTPESGH